MKSILSGTIAAIATGQAAGGIGVVRISGEDALAVADRVFVAADGLPLAQSMGYRAHFGRIDHEGFTDDAVALVFRAPHSYTGEDVVEISCHGGLYTTRMALRACITAGARLADKGEFTRRAFENGKLSLTQAEAVMSIIAAQGRQSSVAAHSAHDGALAAEIDRLCGELRSIAARIAAWCDFPDEDDVPEVQSDGIVADLRSVAARLGELVRGGEAYALCDGIDTVICGKPNVGKSTLMNLLAGCEKSIVTDIPGTTRDIVEHQVRLGDCILRLSDTAGLRDSDDIIENIGVERTRHRIGNAALIIAVFDGAKPLDDDDRRLIDLLCGDGGEDRPCVAVINKSDLPAVIDAQLIEQRFAHCVYISAANNDGVEALERAVMQVTGIEQLDAASAVIINERQLDCARRALRSVEDAIRDADVVTLDAVNLSVYDAVAALTELTGDSAAEDIVSEIFSHFCIGK